MLTGDASTTAASTTTDPAVKGKDGADGAVVTPEKE
jgi:hypothetical protein